MMVLEKMIEKIKNWFKKIFKKEDVKLLEDVKEDIIASSENETRTQFINTLRNEPSSEEIILISKFENGEINFSDITEEMRNKIINGYNILINKNINIIENNMKKI